MEANSREELIFILHGFERDKSFGLDGWTMEFFIGFLEILEGDLLKMIEEFGKIPAPFNSTFIVLIRKSNSPTSFEKYKPVFVCDLRKILRIHTYLKV